MKYKQKIQNYYVKFPTEYYKIRAIDHNKPKRTSQRQNLARLLFLLGQIYILTWVLHIWGIQIKFFLFMTLISYHLNTFYFFFSTMNNYLPNGIKVSYGKLNTVFRFNFTLATVVTIMYWGIQLADPTMMGDADYPLYVDLYLHGGNLLVLIIDRTIIDRDHRFEHRVTTFVLLVFSLFYFITIILCYHLTGVAVYPLIAKLNLKGLSILYVAGFLLFQCGNIVYSLMM